MQDIRFMVRQTDSNGLLQCYVSQEQSTGNIKHSDYCSLTHV